MTAAGRQPFRFRLRTLLLLMLVIGVALGWRVERARRQRKAVQFVQQVRGTYAYDFEYDEAGQRLVDTKPHGPIWLNDRLGVDFFNTVVQVSLSDEPVRDISPLANLPG
ncbi:MAG: hypothetical protein QF805_23895, partial [Pirellulaceae bacterium]|nr:hypothetical protein [Pirellulaceae bacterium]